MDEQLIRAFVLCMYKNAIQLVFDISLISSFFYINIFFVYSYTAKFVLDLLEIRKARFSHDEAHMSKIIQCNYSYLVGKLLVPIYTIYFYFTRITILMQVH